MQLSLGEPIQVYDTLGKIEGIVVAMDAAYQAADNNLSTQITANDSNITTLQNDVSTNTTNLSPRDYRSSECKIQLIIGGSHYQLGHPW